MNSWSIPIDSGCKQALQHLIDQADRTFRATPLQNPAKRRQAVLNFEKLLSEMTWEAGNQGNHYLGEPNLSAALARICPLFPFC
jgi:hypothetical protein